MKQNLLLVYLNLVKSKACGRELMRLRYHSKKFIFWKSFVTWVKKVFFFYFLVRLVLVVLLYKVYILGWPIYREKCQKVASSFS